MIKSATAITILMVSGFISTACQANPVQIDNSAGLQLIVGLHWQESLDLDMFLTDPAGETVYFANRLAKSGVRMGQRTSCTDIAQAPGPYFETIEIPNAIPGRYRVSVDFIKDCDHTDLEADFSVTLKNHAGNELGNTKSTVKYRLLNPVAWEFIVK